MLQSYQALHRADRGAIADAVPFPLVIELVFAQEIELADVQVRLAGILPGAVMAAVPVFGQLRDQYFFVTFADIAPDGQEPQVFAFARDLARAVAAQDANPVLADSLFGAAAIGGPATESTLLSCETPHDGSYPFGWVHPEIRTPQAWALTRGAGSVVAVIDTGHSAHKELAGAILSVGQKNLVEGGTDASDRFGAGWLTNPGHGTLVCSVVASRGSADATGQTSGPGAVTGAAPEADILPIRAIESVINFSQTRIPAAIAHAVAQSADVIAMALGGPVRVASTEKALRDARAAGVVVVCAAGNCWPSVVFPAAYAAQGLCVAVAAVTRSRHPWKMTARGPQVTLSAFGENVWGAAKAKSTDPDNGIRAAQGTTLATSLTAGVAALWVARHGGRAALRQKAAAVGSTVQAMFAHCLTEGLVPPAVWGGATDLGAGILDAERTLNTALPASASGPEAMPEAPAAAQGVQSTAQILVSHMVSNHPEAVADLGPDLADYAAEMLWLSYRAGARSRAAEARAGGLGGGGPGVVETVLIRPASAMPARAVPALASPGLEAHLPTRPALRAALGVV